MKIGKIVKIWMKIFTKTVIMIVSDVSCSETMICALLVN